MHRLLLILFSFALASVQADTLKDPTKPTPSKVSSLGDGASEMSKTLKLTAIIHSSRSSQAIINGQSFVEGQQVLGFKVTLISKNHVVVDSSEGKQTLYVNNNNIKKDANDGF